MYLGTWKATDTGDAAVVWGNSDNTASDTGAIGPATIGPATAPALKRWMEGLELEGITEEKGGGIVE